MSHSTRFPEKFLHEVWSQQLFNTAHIETHEGHRVHIIYPGTPNPDTGPDFLDAKIQIGGTLYVGDVEIHRTLDEWSAHLHHADPRYNRVILHVVMNTPYTDFKTQTESGRDIPTLILENFLIEPIRAVWGKSIESERKKRLDRIPCYGKNQSVDLSIIEQWLETLGRRRLELKVRAMQTRLYELASPDQFDLREPAARYGEIPFGGNEDDIPPPFRPPTDDDLRKRDAWEQLFYESLGESLGYSKNQTPFRRLTSLITFPRLCELSDKEIEAALFGVAGLLKDERVDKYTDEIRKIFEKLHFTKKYHTMDKTEWQFFRLRPQNFPTVRIAGLAEIVRRMSTTPTLQWLIHTINAPDKSEGEKIKIIRQYFTVPASGYWKSHYRFGKKASLTLRHLIGSNRIDEIVINVIIPYLFLYSRIYKQIELRSNTENILNVLTAPSANTITKKIDSELQHTKLKRNTVLLYQGKIQLYKFYCRGERCTECDVGKIVFKE